MTPSNRQDQSSSDDDWKTIIFGWIVNYIGLPEDADPTTYNKLTEQLYEVMQTYEAAHRHAAERAAKTIGVAITLDFVDTENKIVQAYSKYVIEDTDMWLDIDPGRAKIHLKVMPDRIKEQPHD